MDTPPPPPTAVVITDNEAAVRFVRALQRAVSTAEPGAEVVGVTDRPGEVPAALQRRVRLVRLRSPREMREAVAREVAADRVVLVACSSTRLGPGWAEGARRAASAAPDRISVLGLDGHVLVVPAPVRSLVAAEVRVAAIAGVQRSCADAPAPTAPAADLPRPRADRPLRLTACLIVKDEEAVLAECLQALAGVVDEVVVYDTGSTDSTPAIAEAAGAVLVRGYWDDHFGDARQRALAHCTGDWVISVDADEVLCGDVADLRRCLADARGDVMRIPIMNTSWKGAEDGQLFQPVRAFRRERCRWTGALHEFIIERAGQPPLMLSPHVPDVVLRHSGYQYLTLGEKDKASRNLAIARAAVDRLASSGEDETTVWDGYGRALLTAGRHREALEALQHVLDVQGNTSAVLQSGRAAVACMDALGDWADLDVWAQALAQHGESSGNLLVTRARAAVAVGDFDAASELLDAAAEDHSSDRSGVAFKHDSIAPVRAMLLQRRGDPTAALEVLVEALEQAPESVMLGGLVQVALAAGVDFADLAGQLPEAFLQRSAQEAVLLQEPHGDTWLSVLHELRPLDQHVMAAGSVVATRSSLERAVAWAAAVRGAGLAQLCPLAEVARQTRRPLAERATALGLLLDVVGDQGALDDLAALLSSAPEEDVDAALPVLAAAAPGALAALRQLVLEPAG